ncbi:BTAD domain-containing putative transcriptional regulator [Agromyces sp. Marseille-P2726]|uniref:AfsR/SARP family transcriptional regulator n=1 Tax=Agromyces sp. Marseille-P2726 TaxID=2709132 RepID=UPI00156FB273|nr:BTAD domain-containing putative transcriptional regulator [Agromyces sp. Marseille-P2726]
MFIVAPSGAGKSTLLRRLSQTADHTEVVHLGRECRDPAQLESAIALAMASLEATDETTTVAIDDVQVVAGTRGESALQRMAAHCDAEHHLVLASRLPIPAELELACGIEPDLVTAPDLVLRIDEVSQVFRLVAGHPLALESASMVVSETCGWAGPVHDLAVRSRSVEAEALEAAVATTLRGDFAASRLERALRALPTELVRSLELTSDLPTLEFGACARLLGADAAARLFEAVDGGAVMHVRQLGSRVLPPILRRHLRARAGLNVDIALPSPPTVTSPPGAQSAPARPPAPRPAAFDAAMTRLRHGDVVGAVPLLQLSLRTPDEAATHPMARLALLMIRESLAPREATLDALAGLERECVALGMDAQARMVRGAVAAASDLPDRSAAGVVAECEVRGDATSAAVTAGLDFVIRARRGRATSVQANALADRLERLGHTGVAAWSRAAGALLAAASGTADARRQITDAETASIATHVDGTRPLLDAARALVGPSNRAPALMASARRHAFEVGLPRLPSSLPRVARHADGASAPTVVVEPRHPHLTVTCFGGFHLCADGTEIELKVVRPPARALLRMLALNAGAPLHRELIADILWGDLGIDSAVHALHVSVSSLRRALPADLVGPAASIVERVGEAYRLGIADRHDCDLADFDDQLAEAAAAKLRRDAVTTANGLRGALALYVGDVLPEDGPAEWVAGARERYRVRAAEAAASLAHLELRFGDGHAAAAAASRAVEIDPWLDESWRTLVMVHRRSGDVVAAQRAEEGYRSMRVALGVE